MIEDKFIYVTYINTTPEKLWEALTNTSFLQKYWFGSSFSSDWKVGSTIQETMRDGNPGFRGEILEFEPAKLLSYTFYIDNEEKTLVTFTIEEHGEAVKLTTTHQGYKRGSRDYESTSSGWAAILSGLKTLLETGEPLVLGEWEEPQEANYEKAG